MGLQATYMIFCNGKCTMLHFWPEKIKMIQLILQTQNSSSKNRLVVLTQNYMELLQVFTLAQEYKLD